jgi:hypothetical protein
LGDLVIGWWTTDGVTLINQQISKSPDHQITRSPDHQITRSANHQFSQSPDQPISRVREPAVRAITWANRLAVPATR